MFCCKSSAVAEQVAVRQADDPNRPSSAAKGTETVTNTEISMNNSNAESSVKSNNSAYDETGVEETSKSKSYEGFFSKQGQGKSQSADGDSSTVVPPAASSITGLGSRSHSAGDKYTPAHAETEAAPSFSKFTSAASSMDRQRTASSKMSSTSVPASAPPLLDYGTDDTDDGVVTVFSEPTVDPARMKKVRSKASASNVKTSTVDAPPDLKDVPLPKGAYVMLPNAPQRGYEPWGAVSYSSNKQEWIRHEPYKIGTLVWFRREGSSKFKWYIPGRIKNYVFDSSNGGVEVTGYEIDVDCEEEIMDASDVGIVEILKNAPPVDTMLRWDEVVPPCPIAGIENSGTDSSDSALTQARIEKARAQYGDDFGFQGAKQNGIGPTHWGITKEQIFELQKDEKYRPDMTMYDVVNEIIKPKTAGTGMGYALHANKDAPLRAKVMVSHAWGEKFEQFASALRNSPVEGPFWICALAIYQNEDIPEVTIEKQLGPKPENGPFAAVLRQVEKMIAIMTNSCDIYTRLWCVYEIFIAITMNVAVILLAFNEITSSGGGSDAMYSNAVLDSSGKPVVTSEATCGVKADQDMIQSEIGKSGGFEIIDDAVMWVRIKALTDDMEEARMRSWMETMERRPIGSCSASNIVPRQNAGIANAIEVWEKAKSSRVSYGGIFTSLSMGTSSRTDKQSPLEMIQEKILCGSLCS